MGNGFVGWFSRSYKGIIIGLLAIMAVMLVVLAMQHVSSSQSAADEPRPAPTFGSTPTGGEKRQPSNAMRLLDQQDRPFTVVVVGDSTGAVSGNWVRQLAERLSAKYNRPVQFHQWAVETTPNGYQPVQTVGTGQNATITIWNGSASGKGIDYSLENFDSLVPADARSADIAFINHGHNMAPATLADAGQRLLERMSATMPDAALVAVGQNPEGPNGPNATTQNANVTAWLSRARAEGYATVDVLSLFLKQDDYVPLLDSAGVHPTPAGSQLWADAVEQVLAG